jgi:hypothetical protein
VFGRIRERQRLFNTKRKALEDDARASLDSVA